MSAIVLRASQSRGSRFTTSLGAGESAHRTGDRGEWLRSDPKTDAAWRDPVLLWPGGCLRPSIEFWYSTGCADTRISGMHRFQRIPTIVHRPSPTGEHQAESGCEGHAKKSDSARRRHPPAWTALVSGEEPAGRRPYRPRRNVDQLPAGELGAVLGKRSTRGTKCSRRVILYRSRNALQLRHVHRNLGGTHGTSAKR